MYCIVVHVGDFNTYEKALLQNMWFSKNTVLVKIHTSPVFFDEIRIFCLVLLLNILSLFYVFAVTGCICLWRKYDWHAYSIASQERPQSCPSNINQRLSILNIALWIWRRLEILIGNTVSFAFLFCSLNTMVGF